MAAYLPLAICLLACPVIMLVMMKGLGSMGRADDEKPGRAVKPVRTKRPREAELAELKTQMAEIQAKRETLGQELRQVERGAPQTEHDTESVA